MIIKFFELKKKNLKDFKFYLLYGNNQGLINETVNQQIKPILSNNIFKYDENEIIKNIENFKENVSNKSFFEEDKLIIISRSTDKIFKIIEDLVDSNIEDVSFILVSGILEKKSKLRNFFEKNKRTICIPFYEDNQQTLGFVAQNFFKDKKIPISQQNINLIIERCRGDRMNLYNELQKIENYFKNKKTINAEDILKLTNLSENFDVSELIDNTLAKNQKRTLYILNENNFVQEDAIIILRIFISKLKRLLKIQTEISFEKNVEKVILSYKPPIFWKEKDILKKQIQIWSCEKIQQVLIKVNNVELQIKKNPDNSMNMVTNFIFEQTSLVSN